MMMNVEKDGIIVKIPIIRIEKVTKTTLGFQSKVVRL